MQNLHFLEESHEKIYLVYMYSFLIFLFWGRPAHLEAVSTSFSRQKSWTWSMTYPGSGVWWNTKWVNRRMDNLYCFPFFQALLEPCEVVAVAPPSSFCDPGPPIVGPKPPSSSHLDCKSLVKEGGKLDDYVKCRVRQRCKKQFDWHRCTSGGEDESNAYFHNV